jgi:hypothetical protein
MVPRAASDIDQRALNQALRRYARAMLLDGMPTRIIRRVADRMPPFSTQRRCDLRRGCRRISPCVMRPLCRAAWQVSMICVIALGVCRTAVAQSTIAITGDRLSGFVLPIEPLTGDAEFSALRAWTWTVDDTKRLLLEGDVAIRVGGYSFSAPEAAVWINRIPSQQGLINQFALYFSNVSDPTERAGMGVSGQRVLITASTRGPVKLNVAQLTEQPPTRPGVLPAAEARLAEHLKQLAAQKQTLRNRPSVDSPAPPPEVTFVPVPGGRVTEKDVELPSQVQLPQAAGAGAWLNNPQGIVRWSADSINVSRGESENLITVDGSIVVDFVAERATDTISQLTLSAERGVIFTDPGPLDEIAASQLESQVIRGIYLEGNVSIVAQNGEYIIRTPRTYYDFRRGQAIMLDSWLRLQNRETRIPVHARAEEMRQIAQNQWDAQNVTVSASEFFTPHLAVGAQRVIIMEQPAEGGQPGETETFIDAEGNTMRVAGVPIVPWPRFRGSVERVPLRSVEIGSDKNDGFFTTTTWDLLTLMGREPPKGLEMDLKADAYFERGPGAGVELRYDVADAQAHVDLYGLYDTGNEDDRTSSGRDVEVDEELRGVAIMEYQTNLSRYWSLQSQLSIISDPTYISSWREDDFTERREYETAVYLKHQRDNAAFTVLGKYSLEDFLANDYLLASRQYSVDKVPELTYRRYGDALFDDRFTYSTETSVSRMRFMIQSGTPNSIGVPGSAFGIPNNSPIDQAPHLVNLPNHWVNRFDTRHELQMPLRKGIFDITPFVVGRFTGYDDDFENFNSDADSMRFWGAGGVRVNTLFQRVYNDVENQLLDLHRLRHLIEPYMVLWGAYSNLDPEDLPIYDQTVEPLQNGAAVELGVRNTWQTQRGGPGNWRSVDYFTLNTAVLFTDPSEPNLSPTPQFFDYRPEYSQFGSSVFASAVWLLSDSLSFVGETTYLLDDGDFARGSVGFELRHSPVFVTYVEYRFIEVDDTELLGIDWQYQITRKYRVEFSPQYSFHHDDLQYVAFRLTRGFPDFELTLQVRYDQIRDDTSLGASMGFAEF